MSGEEKVHQQGSSNGGDERTQVQDSPLILEAIQGLQYTQQEILTTLQNLTHTMLVMGSNFAPLATNGGQVGADKHQLHGNVGNGQNHQDPPQILPEVVQNGVQNQVLGGTSYGQPVTRGTQNHTPGGSSHGQAVVGGVSSAINGVPAAVEVQGRPTEIPLQNGAPSMSNFVPPIVHFTRVPSGSPLAPMPSLQVQPSIAVACNELYGIQCNVSSPNGMSNGVDGQYRHMSSLMMNSQHQSGEDILEYVKRFQDKVVHCHGAVQESYLVQICVEGALNGYKMLLFNHKLPIFSTLIEASRNTNIPQSQEIGFEPTYKTNFKSSGGPSVTAASASSTRKSQEEEFRGRKRKNCEDDTPFPCSVEEVKALVEEWVADGELKLPRIEELLSKKDREGPNYCVFHRSLGQPTEKCRTLKKIFRKKVEADELEFKEQGPQDILEDMAMMVHDGHSLSSW
ncbi:unnamed protein product [Camellia sinensis]